MTRKSMVGDNSSFPDLKNRDGRNSLSLIKDHANEG